MRHCIESILNNTPGVDYEIIVIGDKEPPQYKMVDVIHVPEQKRRGVVVALMEGYKISRGSFVIPMTDDARVDYNWLKPVLDEVKKDTRNIGDFEVYPFNPFQYWGIKFAPFCLISKQRCEMLGGFMDTNFKSFYGDPDLTLRNHVAGGKLVSVPGCKIFHPANNDVVHQVIVRNYVEADRAHFIRKWEPHFGKFPGDP